MSGKLSYSHSTISYTSRKALLKSNLEKVKCWKKSTSCWPIRLCIFYSGEISILLMIRYENKEKDPFFILKKYYEKLREKFFFNYQWKIEIKIIMRETARELLMANYTDF